MGATGALAVVGLGTGFSAMGQQQSGQATQEMYNFNAQVADLQATDALERGAIEAKRRGRVTKQIIGAQRAGLAAQNVDISSGSAADVQADAAYLGELDVATIKNNAAREAWGYRVQAYDQRQRGKFAKRTGTMQAIGTILGSGSNILARKYL